jgi:hypothetical protein
VSKFLANKATGNHDNWTIVVKLGCVTDPTAAGRFLVASGFTGLPLIFPQCTGAVQN